MTVSNLITGSENVAMMDGPVAALSEFYRAFNQQNMSLMSTNWRQDDDIAMSNPLGGIKRGWKEIQSVYEKIFNGPAEVYVEFYDYMLSEVADMFVVAGRERGFFRLEDTTLQLAIRTSRIYQYTADGWRQIHHHGSIDNPQLLAAYQAAVLSAR